MNRIVNRSISAVSNKVNTTDEATMGVCTDLESRTQLILIDTPGATKASNSLRSSLLVTKAWNSIEDSHSLIFVVDAAKRMSFEVKNAVVRLNKRKQSVNP